MREEGDGGGGGGRERVRQRDRWTQRRRQTERERDIRKKQQQKNKRFSRTTETVRHTVVVGVNTLLCPPAGLGGEQSTARKRLMKI